MTVNLPLGFLLCYLRDGTIERYRNMGLSYLEIDLGLGGLLSGLLFIVGYSMVYSGARLLEGLLGSLLNGSLVA